MKLKSQFNFQAWQKMAQGMLSRSALPAGYLARVVYKQILQIQLDRWQSENVTQGPKWDKLTDDYAKRKLKKYAAYRGRGTKLLIATGALWESMTGQDLSNHYQAISNTSIEVGTLLPYAKWVNEKRNITNLTTAQIRGFRKGFIDYVLKGTP